MKKDRLTFADAHRVLVEQRPGARPDSKTSGFRLVIISIYSIYSIHSIHLIRGFIISIGSSSFFVVIMFICLLHVLYVYYVFRWYWKYLTLFSLLYTHSHILLSQSRPRENIDGSRKKS